MNPQKFKDNFDRIKQAEENARDTIEGALQEKYIFNFNYFLFLIEKKMMKKEKLKQKKN